MPLMSSWELGVIFYTLLLVLCVKASTSSTPTPLQFQIDTRASQGWDLGADFTLSWAAESLRVKHGPELIWSTVPRTPFISASAGNDSVTGSNGAFTISQVDDNKCKGQNITAVESVSWSGTVTGSAAQVQGYLLDCGSYAATYELTFWVPEDLPDRVDFWLDIVTPDGVSPPLKKSYFSFASSADEDIYGLGAQASFASLKNQSIPIFSREQGVGRGDEPITSIENANGSFAGGDAFTTYTAIPSFITTAGRVLYLSEKSTGYANFSFARSDQVTIRYDSLSMDGAFASGSTMLDAIGKLTEYTGRMPPLPNWVDNGAILGIQGGQDKVNRIVQQGLNLSCPIAGVWLQDWVGTHSQAGPYINISRLWWNWENDAQLYPTWNEFVQDLRDQSIRTLSYINPFLANVSTKSGGYRRNLYAEADPLHYFVQNMTVKGTAVISSGPGLDAGIVDLTNSNLRDWFEKVLATQVWNANISGFMTDFGEYTPVTADTALAEMASDAFFFHNQYPFLWARYHREVVERLNLTDEAVLFHRSAAMGANRFMNLFWAGDQNVGWGLNDGIKSVVTICSHMGMSGYANSHSDVGGYTTTLTYDDYNLTRSAELLGRWGELGAISGPVFRSHEGNIPSVNAQFYSNTTTYEYFAYNARMFASLGQYRRKILETECETKGWPLLRHPVLYHAEDARARAISFQSFYLGPDLYVAPVLDPLTFELEVYLPGSSNTSYEHVWTGATFHGGQGITVATPYGKPAVFLVHGGNRPELRPFLEFVQTENNTLLQI